LRVIGKSGYSWDVLINNNKHFRLRQHINISG